MYCPKCGNALMGLETVRNKGVVLRKRRCKGCGENYYTKEVIDFEAKKEILISASNKARINYHKKKEAQKHEMSKM